MALPVGAPRGHALATMGIRKRLTSDVLVRAYGLVVKSPYPLAAAERGSHQPEVAALDLEFFSGSTSDFLNARQALALPRTKNTPWFQHARLPDGRDYLRWPQLFEFLIAQDGRRITGHPLKPVSQETFQTYLLAQVLSFALLRMGIESLHATTVVITGKAVAFLGDCGDGKSTLAAACLKAGFTLLTDDLLVLKQANGHVFAYPGPPRIKLMPSIARRLMGPRAEGFPMNPLTSKQVIPLEAHQYASFPVPLHAIYALRFPRTRKHSRVVIRRLSVRAAWYELTRGTFNLVLRDPDRLMRQFAWACRLAARIPVKVLSYPRTLQNLSQVVRAVASDVTS